MSFRSRQAILLTVAAGSMFVATTARAQVPPEHQPPPNVPSPVSAQPFYADSTHRSVGLAVALSLTPLPVDFGNLYAENLGWGVTYTVVEVALMAPMMWFAGRHMSHNGSDNRRWNDEESGLMYGLAAGFVAVKIVAGIHASYAARDFNRRSEPRTSAMLVPTRGGGLLGWQRTY